MQPLKLILKGFRGIRDGLGLDEITLDLERLAEGAELIAIAGPNGSGKTTIMDSLTPYNVLASRSATAGTGGFSYYDHVYLPENEKILTWAHEGRRYRSHVVIRMNGRRKTEAFLHWLDAAGRWQPVRIDDGTVSDGRVETYTCCIECICGSAETFFTSVFAAQGKRQLNTYRNAEIKTLLADLLGQEEIRSVGQKATETARLLKTGLAAIRQEQAALADEAGRVEAARQRLDCCASRITSADNAKHVAQAVLDSALGQHACLAAEREQSQAVEARRAHLMAERRSLLESAAESSRILHAQDQAECNRLERLDQRVAGRLQRERVRRQTLEQSRQRCMDLLGEADAVRHAACRLALAQRLLKLRNTCTLASLERVHALTRWQGMACLAEQKLAGIKREIGRTVLRAEELAHRLGLTDEVPCAGTDLQGRCKLLGDAREAQALIPSARSQVARQRGDRVQALQELSAASRQCDALAGAPQALAWAECREAATRERAGRLQVLASKEAACVQAEAMLAEIERELAALRAEAANAALTSEEQAERRQIDNSRQAIAHQLDQQAERTAAALTRLDQELVALPPAYDEKRLVAATQALGGAREALAMAERSLLAAVRDAQASEELSRQASALAGRRDQAHARCARVETELANWNLLARCMSNDGLIALVIDDAGPALSALANELLLACYGPRLTVSIHTLLETSNGEHREGFDIVVHDGQTGDTKSVGLMSGGERTWVEACLTRAIALYLATHTGRRYTTLFTDEADGSLDPDRKRMFMVMKREVLRLGGYEREYFVSQTPELTAMADAVIDLNTLKLAQPEVS